MQNINIHLISILLTDYISIASEKDFKQMEHIFECLLGKGPMTGAGQSRQRTWVLTSGCLQPHEEERMSTGVTEARCKGL